MSGMSQPDHRDPSKAVEFYTILARISQVCQASGMYTRRKESEEFDWLVNDNLPGLQIITLQSTLFRATIRQVNAISHLLLHNNEWPN